MTSGSSIQTLSLLGSYVPRRCGIGTFTKDLHDGIKSNDQARETLVLALDDTPAGYPYPNEVRFQIQANRVRDYTTAADLININQIDLAIIQHEYGIYGGRAGDHVLAFADNLRMPLITTLHTVLAEPSPEQKAVIQKLAQASERLVLMTHMAVRMLVDIYEVPAAKVTMIPHGIPDVPFVDPSFNKDQFGLEGRSVLMTFGLLSPGKGIEVGIRALPAIVKRHPDAVYLILGAIHPHVHKRDGNAYLHSLERLAEKNGVRDHVIFHTRYVSLEELCGYLAATDIYLTPYPHKAQIVSGTLAYAMGAGKAVLSTPYWHAEEMLADGRGGLFPFGEVDTLARMACEWLDDPLTRNAVRKRAYMYCRHMVWNKVAGQYLSLGEQIVEERRQRPRPSFYFRSKRPRAAMLPEINIQHLRTLTDDTGILQHAIYAVPDRTHGYCTDDNARALLAAVLYYDWSKDEAILPYVNVYLSFLHHAFNRDEKRFRNFLSYDRHWLEEVGSEDVHGRSIWALGLAVSHATHDAMLSFASRLFASAVETVGALRSPRAWAFSIVGIHAYLERFGGDTSARRIRAELAGRLFELFRENSSEDWPWCEDVVTYDNAKLPHALILSGQWLPDPEMLAQGIKSLEWLYTQQVSANDTISLIGNQGWMKRSGARARFDQQPVDAQALVEACLEAFRYTRDSIWRDRAHVCLGWFLGHNDTQSMLYDFSTGGCRDGLQPYGPNLNQGAESTLTCLIALLIERRMNQYSIAVVPPKRPQANDPAGSSLDADKRKDP